MSCAMVWTSCYILYYLYRWNVARFGVRRYTTVHCVAVGYQLNFLWFRVVYKYRRDFLVPGSPCYQFDSMLIWVQCWLFGVRVAFVSVLFFTVDLSSIVFYVGLSLFFLMWCLYKFQSFLFSQFWLDIHVSQIGTSGMYFEYCLFSSKVYYLSSCAMMFYGMVLFSVLRVLRSYGQSYFIFE